MAEPPDLGESLDPAWLWANEPCRAACPVHTDAGAYVTAIAEGRDRDAYRIARASNPFVSICGRVCAAPCETACRRGTLDAPVAIRSLKRFVTEQFGVESFNAGAEWHAAHGPVPPAELGSVGVIGGGPAGLSAAHDLRMAGCEVTVYEASDNLGGLMVLGIPEYRLERALIARECQAIIDLGVEAQLGVKVGDDVTMAELLERHDAVFVAAGCMLGRTIQLPGHELDGHTTAMEFLLNVNQGFKVELGERVVVVGGGNVAFDAARTAMRAALGVGAAGDDAADDRAVDAALATAGVEPGADAGHASMTATLDVARAARRAGVTDVTVIALESPEEMPADAIEIAEATEEGITILYRRGPVRFVGDGPALTGLETIEVASVFDADGRFAPVFREGTESVLPADTVILAVGQTADLSWLGEVELERSPQGGVKVDPTTLRTSNPRVWAGGDIARGPRNLIDAVADGQRAARAIIAGLTGISATAVPIRMTLKPRDGFHRLSTGYDAIERVPMPALPSDRRVGFKEVELGYDAAQAKAEGLRCLRCFDNIMLDPSLCILCGLCVDVCPPHSISIVRADRLELGTDDQSVLLIDEDTCIRCGLCVNRCPPHALSMEFAKEITP